VLPGPDRLVRAPAQTRSVLGLFVLPARYYPWVLLVVWQLLMPGVSFLGHLGGVAAGQGFVWGLLRWAMPPASAFQVRAPLPSVQGACAGPAGLPACGA
jgi:hypothetical protein